MNRVMTCQFPQLSPEFNELFADPEKQLIVVGVIGKSLLPNCSKMSFDLFSCHASFVDNEINRKEGSIKFFYETGSAVVYVHFETSFDAFIASDLMKKSDFEHFLPFNSQLRTRFAQSLLFATQVCHIIVLVEPSSSFDVSYLPIFKALKIIREKYVMKFLPKILKNSSVGAQLGKEARFCSPRVLFFFEKSGRDSVAEDVTAHEIEMEDYIYAQLRTNFVITNNANNSLFSIPKNKKFLYINTDENINSDPIADSLDCLFKYIEMTTDDLQISPYRGYGGVQYEYDEKTIDYEDKKKRNFIALLNEHVNEAIQGQGFDDSISKYRGKTHFVRTSMKAWFDTFKLMHKIFIENPRNGLFEANDPDYKSYLENFHKVMDIDEQFFSDVCSHGYDLALANYSELLPQHYSRLYHMSKLEAALEVFHKYARSPDAQRLEEKIKDNCDSIWMNGKQQCERMSLRENPCILIANHEGNTHTSGIHYISACNCGKTQGRRDDPYTIRKANFEFYEVMADSCSGCEKSEAVEFPVFVPSGTEFKPAEVLNKNLAGLILSEYSNKTPTDDKVEHQLHLSASQVTQPSDLSLGSSVSSEEGTKNNLKGKRDISDDSEIVVKIGELGSKEEQAQASTTEYLPNMLLLTSPPGFLPQFSSWSLACIASSSFYSHNTGLTESQMPGFLSGTNFLLCWEVKVRLEHAQNWAENYEKNRSRKKHKQPSSQQGKTELDFTLKIFVGMEYECGHGHRFFMSSNSSVMRGIAGGSKVAGCGSKVVFSDMPLYFPCPCKNNSVAQLMRVHVVTPKAPVSINLDPKVKIRRESEMTFTAAGDQLSLRQSAYYVLRLPYVYQGDNEPIKAPLDLLAAADGLGRGCLVQGMFSIKENDTL